MQQKDNCYIEPYFHCTFFSHNLSLQLYFFINKFSDTIVIPSMYHFQHKNCWVFENDKKNLFFFPRVFEMAMEWDEFETFLFLSPQIVACSGLRKERKKETGKGRSFSRYFFSGCGWSKAFACRLGSANNEKTTFFLIFSQYYKTLKNTSDNENHYYQVLFSLLMENSTKKNVTRVKSISFHFVNA